jgi:hypothetical protein
MTSIRLTLITILCIGLTTLALSAGRVAIVKKHLPLDVIPNAKMKTPQNSHYLPNKIIIRMQGTQQGLSKQSAEMTESFKSFLSKYSATSIEHMFSEASIASHPMNLSKFYVMTYSVPMDPFKVAKEISHHADVLYAEPWFIYPVDACTPNDSLRSSQWALTKILADSAFCTAAGDTSVSIGIVDTGVRWDHPDLAGNIYINYGEYGDDGHGGRKETNGVDDDGDGYVDNWHGWDFGGSDYNNPVADNNPSPQLESASHGTHVAGIAAARTNNVSGISGISNNCRIMPVKVGSDNDTRGNGAPYIVFGFQGIYYAAQHGAKVINCSWGGQGASQYEQEVIDSVTSMGALVVCAAGNGAQDATVGAEAVNYPAGYRNVISVAATASASDYRAAYTQYGETIDVSAPGSQILSTYFSNTYGNTYAYMDGTSMASPLVAGLAALVKSKFPSYTPLQVGEQVRVTCDDIYSANTGSTIKYKLGKGRINALRAVTETQWPSIRINTWRAVDSVSGNSNGTLEPNETFALKINFINYLQSTTAAATVQLATYDSYVSISQAMFAVGAVPTMGIVGNDANPFVVHIGSNMPAAHIVQFVLKITDASMSYTDFQLLNVEMNPTYATHNVNNVQTTITNNGRVGFNDFPDNNQGVGFVYKGSNQLYEAGLIVGYSATKLVDVVRNPDNVQDADFSSTAVYTIVNPGPIATQEGYAQCTDAASADKIGLTIDTRSYAFKDAPDTNYVIVRYDITNTSGARIDSLYAGMFFDWDMLPTYTTNKTAFDASRSLAYAYDDSAKNPVYCGVRALDTAASYRALINDLNIDLTKAGKWDWLSGGIVPMADTVADIHLAISQGPYSIPAGGKQRIGFAIIAGDNLADLQKNADFAKAKWPPIFTTGVREEKNVHPASYALHQNYPNPFNPATVISYDIPSAGKVTLSVYDVLGQVVTTLVNQEQQPGRYDVTFDGSKLSSGVYFYRLSVGGSASGSVYTDVRKLLLVR